MRTPALSLLAAAGLFACTASTSDPAPASTTSTQASADCPDGTQLTWENFGGPFLRSWCNGCHSASLEGAARKNAPVGIDFESLADVRKHSARIYARAAAQAPTMPPAGGASSLERNRLAEWIACGTRGIEQPRTTPPSTPIETGGGKACGNVAALPDPTAPRCAAATRSCISECAGKDAYDDCTTKCFAADTTAKDPTTGFDCATCVQVQLLKCVDANGCRDGVGATLCCKEGCTGSACDERCARAQQALGFCVGYVTPHCYDFGGKAMAGCFPP